MSVVQFVNRLSTRTKILAILGMVVLVGMAVMWLGPDPGPPLQLIVVRYEPERIVFTLTNRTEFDWYTFETPIHSPVRGHGSAELQMSLSPRSTFPKQIQVQCYRHPRFWERALLSLQEVGIKIPVKNSFAASAEVNIQSPLDVNLSPLPNEPVKR